MAGDETNTDVEGGANGDAVERARHEVIEAMARAAESWGLNGSYGRLYGILYFAGEPVSLDEIVDRSDYAKSTVSTAMSAMERYHLVHRRSIPGEGKKAYYEAETDFWHVFQQFLNQEVRSEVRIMTRALDDAEATLEAADSERATRDLERIRKLQRMYDHSETLIDVLTAESLDRIVGAFQRLRTGK